MTSTIPPSLPPKRGKQHKQGKVLSIGLIVVCLAVVIGAGIVTLLEPKAKKQRIDANVIQVVDSVDKLQPISPKIVAMERMQGMPKSVYLAPDYKDIWVRLLAMGDDTKDGTRTAILTFLNGLGFTATEVGGIIFLEDGKTPADPATIECYLNGYIPEKPYIKVNCASF